MSGSNRHSIIVICLFLETLGALGLNPVSVRAAGGNYPHCGMINNTGEGGLRIQLTKGALVSEVEPDSYDQCAAGAIRIIKFNSAAAKEATCLDLSVCTGSNNTGNLCVESSTVAGADSETTTTIKYYCVTRAVTRTFGTRN